MIRSRRDGRRHIHGQMCRADCRRTMPRRSRWERSRRSGRMWLLSIAAQIAAAMAVSAAMATALYERRREIGLMKALGADTGRVRALFFAETFVLAIGSGLAGYALGALLARFIGKAVFGSAVVIQPILLPFVLLAACLVTLAGSARAINRVSGLDRVLALKGEA